MDIESWILRGVFANGYIKTGWTVQLEPLLTVPEQP